MTTDVLPGLLATWCGAPGCERLGVAHCAFCSRPLCLWHHAGQPLDLGRGATLWEVCLPDCRAGFWKVGAPEWAPRET